MNDSDKELKQNKDDIRHLILLILRKIVRKTMLFLIPMAIFSGWGVLMYLPLIACDELALNGLYFTIFLGFIAAMIISYFSD